MSKRILVTGGCGFIGTNFVRKLLSSTSHQILNLDKLTYAGNTGSLSDVEDHANYSCKRVDLANSDSTSAAVRGFRPDWIVHLAAESHVDRSITAPSPFVQSNIVGTFNLLAAALNHYRSLTKIERETFRLLHVSTDEVFGQLQTDDQPFTEESSIRPRSPYSASKAAADHLVSAWYHTYGLPTLTSHSCNNYGPFQFPEKLIPVALIGAIQGRQIPLYGDGTNMRDWLYVDDQTEALLTILREGVPGNSYNIGGRFEATNLELVRLLCEILSKQLPESSNDEIKSRNFADGTYSKLIMFVPDRPAHDFRYAINASKAETELGWKAKVDIDTGLTRTVEWYLKNRKWWFPLWQERMKGKAER